MFLGPIFQGFPSPVLKTCCYHMANFVSGQDKPNPCGDWLPERARWSYLACSALLAVSREKNFPESHEINPLLAKLVWSRWLDIGLVLFCEFMDGDGVEVHKHAKKRGWHPAILNSHLVNNPVGVICLASHGYGPCSHGLSCAKGEYCYPLEKSWLAKQTVIIIPAWDSVSSGV